ncbi:MAG: transposase [Patescibacteria group bacterium]
MGIRKHKFVIGEYYHIYNRGSDKRAIVLDNHDLERFLESIEEFNNLESIGSIYELSFQKEKLGHYVTKKKLVSMVAYCVNPNHFHFLITPLVKDGIEKFMKKFGGYSRYFNEKYERNGVLFQGKFQSKHISDNRYLLHVSSYINMNNRNKLGHPVTKLSKSSLEEYIENKKCLCDIKIVSEQFKNGKEYLDFALEAWQNTLERKNEMKFK